MKRIILFLLALSLLFPASASGLAAASADASGMTPASASASGPAFASVSGRSARTITDFAPLADSRRTVPENTALEDLLPTLPAALDVTLDGERAELPVSWVCAGGGYGDYFYYQFDPVWDEASYRLAPGVEPPWIGVFWSDGQRPRLLSVTGAVYEETIFYWLTTEMELNSAAACGVMANLYAESGFRPDNLQGSYEKSLGYTDESYTDAVDSGTYGNFIRDQAGYGLCQWTYWSRKEGLLSLARTRGTSVGDLLTQLEYLRAELSSRYAPYAAALSALRSVPDTAEGAYEAASVFCVKYEQPANTEAAAAVRGNLARDTYFAEYGPPPADDPEGVEPAVEAVHSGGAVTVTVRDGTAYEAVYCAIYGADGQFLAFASYDEKPDLESETTETETGAGAEAEPGVEARTGEGQEADIDGEIKAVRVHTFLFGEIPFHSAKIVLTDGNRIPLYAVESEG